MTSNGNRPLAILGGTFDPVHLGHLRVAWEAAEFLDSDVHLLPANVPPHRAQPVASADQRVAILRAALRGQDRLILDERELRRDGPSYTVDTLISLRKEIGPTRPIVLLVGADAFSALPSWHRWQELFDLAHIGVLNRAGHEMTESAELSEQVGARRTSSPADLAQRAFGLVIQIRVSALEISATQIRNELAAGREPHYLVPDAILADRSLLAPYRFRKP
ncbi:MAG: nicotinate-nucleotide adenylyltransferase [Dokdonella sp.]